MIMKDTLAFLREEGVSADLIAGVEAFRNTYSMKEKYRDRIPDPSYR